MARPTAKPRVPSLDPERESTKLVQMVLDQMRITSKLLEPLADALVYDVTDAQLRSTALYRDFVQVARYAVNGIRPRGSLSQLLGRLAPLLHATLLPSQDIEALLESVNPDDEDDPVKLLLAAAVARAQLDAGTNAVTSTQLAILAGVTRRHVGAEIREGRLEADIAGRRGTAGAALIRPEEAWRWLCDRGVLGCSR